MVSRADPERALALSYAPADARAGMAALLALDDALAAILRTTREPMVGQMRLTWWYEALGALDERPSPANPVLQALAVHVLPHVSGKTLAAMVDGWEALLDEPLDTAAMERFAEARGGGLFGAAGAVLGVVRAGLEEAGAGWALADLAANLGDPGGAATARALAAPRLARAMRGRWPVRARALGALVLLARPGTPGSPARVARLLWHRATGL
ncbi:squalene/phytoene synthase family protein [Sphingomonas sp.]|uniref:squalene/phytoene synthase family protein n=1 Tax=Sphingomonas sp. TaxID=28214 RepID=UPI0035BBA4B0